MDIPISAVNWHPCYRIVPSRFPPINLFEEVADPDDLDAVFQIEAMTNDRLREEAGDLSLVPKDDRVSGPGTSPIMAAFTHLNPDGDRFTNGSYGVFYAGDSIETAIAETRYHRTKFMLATQEPRQELDMRVYAVELDAELHNIRDMRESHAAYYHPDNYAVAQELADSLRKDGSDGIVYQSVRYENGECAAIFRPRLLSNCRQERHLCYVWNGARISNIYEKQNFE
ncbi:RES family NAD+ phosphorylase [Parasphingorhabdus sp.]|uniref:RES family NAD+ phosphorylase n=1 Tax=Parasphingorhabdus sp. TaxID=2709688 RepID=UPI002F92B523